MKRLLFAFAIVTFAGASMAQGTNGGGSFSIGPRYSNYATDVELGGVTTVETGRQHAIGLMGDYRNGSLVVDFMLDHDPENGVSVADILPFEFDNYSRDRGEVLVGYSVLPQLDISGGVRLDSVSIGSSIFGDSIVDDTSFEHQALAAGIRLHSAPGSSMGAWLAARGYIGTADFDGDSFGSQNTDTTGYRAEIGISIPLGGSNWSLAPALEFERLETDNDRVNLETNRLMLNFIYRKR